MLPSPKIVVIDDEKEDVEAILEALNSLGTVAVGLHYMAENVTLRTFPSLRILFLDLHLLPGAGDTNHQIKNTVGLLAQLLTPENGPYAIILWSGHASEYERFKQEVHERLPLMHVPPPLEILSLDKASHVIGDRENGRNKRTVIDPEDLQREVLSRIRKNPQMAALLSWETHVEKAADDTIRQISSLADTLVLNEEEGGSLDRSRQLSVVLAELAVASAGIGGANKNAFRATNQVLVPVLTDRILHCSTDDETGRLWKEAVSEPDEKSYLKDGDPVCAALHGFLHIEKGALITNVSAEERGVVVDLSELSEESFSGLWGYLQGDILKEIKLSGIAHQWVMIQMQAPCDHVQARSGLLPYLLGVRVVLSNSKLKEIRKQSATWASPRFEEEGEQPLLIFHLRFVAGLSRHRIRSLAAPVRYRLREQILSELTHAVHSHGARPGIIRFPR